MATTITILDTKTSTTYDITDRTQSFNVVNSLDTDTDVFRVQCIDIVETHLYDILTIDDGTNVIDGFIVQQDDRGDFSYENSLGDWVEHKITTFTVSTSKLILSRRQVAEIYTTSDSTQGKPSLIIKDLASKYLNSIKTGSPLITTNNVKTSPSAIISTDEDLVFPYVTFMDALTRMVESLINWHWYIDSDNDLHFFENYESISSTKIGNYDATYTSGIILRDTLNVNLDGSRKSNRVWVVGSEEESSDSVSQTFFGDGNNDIWNLSYDFESATVNLNGSPATVASVDNNNGTEDFLYDAINKILTSPDWQSTPISGDQIDVEYNPLRQLVEMSEDTTSQQEIDLWEYIVKDADIVDRLSARTFARALINELSITRRIITFSSLTRLDLGKAYNIGIKSDLWDVKGLFLCTERSFQRTSRENPDNPYTFYSYVFREVI